MCILFEIPGKFCDNVYQPLCPMSQYVIVIWLGLSFQISRSPLQSGQVHLGETRTIPNGSEESGVGHSEWISWIGIWSLTKAFSLDFLQLSSLSQVISYFLDFYGLQTKLQLTSTLVYPLEGTQLQKWVDAEQQHHETRVAKTPCYLHSCSVFLMQHQSCVHTSVRGWCNASACANLMTFTVCIWACKSTWSIS